MVRINYPYEFVEHNNIPEEIDGFDDDTTLIYKRHEYDEEKECVRVYYLEVGKDYDPNKIPGEKVIDFKESIEKIKKRKEENENKGTNDIVVDGFTSKS